ncbi:sporulation protein [Shewanella sp. Scap07]|uniref:SPOR domain-containing protein n=1 Tax=Shewanella sp. Scap07 TaxID=2589987 RepID=UPI0015BEE1FA|nr:SPOR domain-containing protein [Shewanella sp. Scap07]QLE87101.1 sporulation protein [Shewanella sp. Scap07]
MTSRDYANRKPANKGRGKAKSNRGRGKAAAPKRFPLLLAIVTLALLGGFGYFLWTINNSAGTVETVEPEVVTPAPAVKKQDPNALPPKPKEQWTYQQELENKTVEVDIPESTAPTRPYQMQCGSFRTESQANEMKAVIAFQGLEAQVRRTTGKNGVWYRVVLGPYERKRAAEKDRHVIQRAGINGCQVWFWEG